MSVNLRSTRGPSTRPRQPVLRGEINRVYRQAILDAAEGVFSAHGFAAAKMADVARAAGLAAGTLYNYFDSKEEIVRALIERRGDELLARLEALAAGPGDVADVLMRVVRGSFEHFEAHRTLFAAFAELGAKADRGDCALRCYSRYVGVIESLLGRAAARGELARGAPVADVAVLLVAAIHGTLRAALLGSRKGSVEDRARLIVEVFMNGIRRPG